MPGVQITTNVRGGPSASVQPSSGQWFVAGQFERGATDKPVRIRGVADLHRNFGGRTSFSDSYDQLLTYFNEGGQQAWVVRVIGTSPVTGSLTLKDRAATPQNTLQIDAASAGQWSGNLTVEVTNGPVADTFRITVRLNGEVVEDYNNLVNPADAVSKFNTSSYVRVVNIGSATPAPSNNPGVLTPTALTSGSDDRASITSTTYVNALAKFTPELGDGAVSIPGQTGSIVFGAIDAHAKANNRIGITAAGRGESAGSLQATAASQNTEYTGLFAPWVVVPTGTVGTRTISPEGYVAAARARAHAQFGPWRVPAGQIAQANYVTDVDQQFTAEQADSLDAAKVSIIRKVGTSVRNYGWRSLSNDVDNFTYLKDRDLLNRLTIEGASRLEQFVWETIDSRGHLLSIIEAELVGMLDPIANANGLYAKVDAEGNEIDPGYVVSTGSDINPISSLAQDRINATIGVRVSPTGALINLTITKVSLLANLA